MEKPICPIKPWPPGGKSVLDKMYTEEPIIDIAMLANEDSDFDEYLDDWKDQNDWKEGDHLPEIIPCGYRNDMGSVADLLKKIPAGLPLENIFISVNRDRMMDEINFSVIYRRPINKTALRDDYNKAHKEYKIKLAQYEIDNQAYNEWVIKEDIKNKQEEISALENRLAWLKK